jgi:hypothetical protein
MTWGFIYIGILYTDNNNQLLITPPEKKKSNFSHSKTLSLEQFSQMFRNLTFPTLMTLNKQKQQSD